MAVTQEGEFIFEDRQLYGGIRQDLPPTTRRFSNIKNLSHVRKNVLTKRKGVFNLNTTAISGTPELLAAYDMHFNDGTQKVVVAAGSDAYLYNPTTALLDAQSLTLTTGKTSIINFANDLLLSNGTEFKKYNGSTWSNVANSPPIGTLLTVHANRAIIAGVAARPYEFYYTGVRNVDSSDSANDKVIVGGTSGEEITALGELGRWMLVTTSKSAWLYLQSTTNKGDWDFVNLSSTVGCVSPKSVFSVARQAVRMTLFWSLEGAMVAYQVGNDVGIKPLWRCIYRMVNGETIATLSGIETSRFNQISGGYNPELREACFGVPKVGETENSMMLCYDLDALTAYVLGEADQPIVTVKDNANSGAFPCDVLLGVRVDSVSAPSVTGKSQMFGGRQGKLFRHEMPNTYKDEGATAITYWAEREGYCGEEDGVAGFEKVATRGTITATQNGGFASTVIISADSDAESGSEELSLDVGLGLWGDGGNWTPTTSVSRWNGATIKSARGNYGVHGRNFRMSVTDYGVITNKFELSEMSLDGYVYERQ